ncbi:hypothetical protein GCM10009760_56440 [Kitasatospora kazusensis]|uniref:Uncharacterized protein n=1 Tax=Kitasatospora kazusensis TaxID=407974 RepID=A0ABN3A859_9ACTN
MSKTARLLACAALTVVFSGAGAATAFADTAPPAGTTAPAPGGFGWDVAPAVSGTPTAGSPADGFGWD